MWDWLSQVGFGPGTAHDIGVEEVRPDQLPSEEERARNRARVVDFGRTVSSYFRGGRLDPELEQAFKDLQGACASEGFSIRMTEGYRSRKRQASLYAQGRTAPGPVVTNAKPGQSKHEKGDAFDIAIAESGVDPYDAELLAIAGEIGTELGLVWGGNFSGLADTPHFEMPS